MRATLAALALAAALPFAMSGTASATWFGNRGYHGGYGYAPHYSYYGYGYAPRYRFYGHRHHRHYGHRHHRGYSRW